MTKYCTYWYRPKGAGEWVIIYKKHKRFPSKGQVTDYAIWSEPLSPTQLLALSNGTRPYRVSRRKLIEWWPMDGLAP